jgi:hypothetical protein
LTIVARASQLFHTIVVVGTAMGCGSTQEDTGRSDAGALPSPEAASFGATDCPSPAQYQCDAGSPEACGCNLQAPLGVCDCVRPGEFRCRDCLSGPPILGRCPLGDGVSCFCNTSIEIAAPTDCAHPEQFACSPAPAVPAPVDASLSFNPGDWFDYAKCACDTTRPLVTTDCSCTSCGLSCQTGTCPPGTAGAPLSGVRFDCACVPLVVPIAR